MKNAKSEPSLPAASNFRRKLAEEKNPSSVGSVEVKRIVPAKQSQSDMLKDFLMESRKDGKKNMDTETLKQLIMAMNNDSGKEHNKVKEVAEGGNDDFDFEVKTVNAPACTSLPVYDIDFTLVTQLSTSRLSVLEEQCRRWGPHPMSIAVGSEEEASKDSIVRALAAMGCYEKYVTVTVMWTDDDKGYPVNKLRNVALAAVKTSHAVYVDADFLISANLYDRLMDQRVALQDHKTAIVLPAFELRPICEVSNPDCRKLHHAITPSTKSQLVEMFGADPKDKPSIVQFDAKNNVDGHGSTRYNDWLGQAAQELLPIECVTSDRYEPYLVVRYCQELPPFQEAFSGYGQNKLTWMKQVVRSGYRLFQLGDGFLIHFPHAKSAAFKSWEKKKKKEGREALQVEHVAKSFDRWLKTAIPDQSVTPYCPVDIEMQN